MRERLASAMRLIWGVCYPLLIYSFICMGTAAVMEAAGFAPYGEAAVVQTAIAALIAAVPLGLLYRRDRREEPQTRHWKPQAGIWTALAGIGSCFFVNNLINLTGLTSKAYEEVSELLYRPPLAIQIAAVGFLIPVTEELVFRGLGYLRMRRKLSFFRAAMFSAIYFGWYHGNIVQGLYAGCLGFLLAGVYEAYRSLWASICFHMAANLGSVLYTELVPDTVKLRIPLLPLLLISGAVMIFGLHQIREDVKKREVTVSCDSLL